MSPITIIATSDGSNSLLNTSLNETYHSVHGAVTESKYVFIQQGLDFWFQHNKTPSIRILEIGFGTGLNALLTLLQSKLWKVNFYYESWDIFPIDAAIINQLNLGEQLASQQLFSKIHEAPWNQAVQITDSFTLRKNQSDILSQPLIGLFDLVYYDAFAPSKEPALWTADILGKVTGSLNSGGIWVTYCAKGQLKRDLKALGLVVETLPGAPGKKEMVRAKVMQAG